MRAGSAIFKGMMPVMPAVKARKQPDDGTEEESQPLIDYLNRHATQPEFVYRQMWRENDLLVWDNRCTLHQALGDFDENQIRHLERTTVKGTPSGYVVANC